MRRFIALLTALLLLPCLTFAEDAPLTLRTATSVEEAEQFLLLPGDEDVAAVQRGYIRYIAQNTKRDPAYRKSYWLGGEEGSVLDLTLTKRYEHEFDFHIGVMCTRASYSMLLSYFGIDMSPGKMSEVTGQRNLYEPYTEISEMFGLEFYDLGRRHFDEMVQSYLTDDSYSPVYLYFQKPNGNKHSVLVIGYMPDTGRYLVVDSNPYFAFGKPYRVYFMSFNLKRTRVINSTFADELVGSVLLEVWQWRLPPESESEAEAEAPVEAM